MTTTTKTDHLALIEAAYARATGQWTGLDWEGIRDTVEAIERAEARSEAALDHAWYLAEEQAVSWYIGRGEASSEHQAHRRRLREAMGARDLDALLDLAYEEETDVEAAADQAQEWAAEALAAARGGDLAEAARCASKAAIVERAYGDAPVWGPFARACDDALRSAD